MPVDLYVGGAEHAVLHLLYARFWHKVLYDIGIVSTKEPFQKLFNQGMILAFSYRDDAGRYYEPDEGRSSARDSHFAGDMPVTQTRSRRCRSRASTSSIPTTSLSAYGADSLRLYEMFMGPLEMTKPWQTSACMACGISSNAPGAWSATTMPPSVRDWSTSRPILSSCACSTRPFER